MRSLIRRAWALAYFAVVLIPLGLALGSDRPAGANAAYEVSVASGLVALSLLTVTYVLPNRVRALSRGLGIDVVLGVHRLVGVSALAFVVVHIVSVLLIQSSNLGLLDPRTSPMRAKAALACALALLLQVVMSLLGRRLIRRFEILRGLHVVLAVAILVSGGLHVLWLNHLVADPLFARWFAFLLVVVCFVSLRRWVWRPLRALIHPFLVSEVRRESPTVSTVVLEPWGHRGLVKFQPGQFAWVRFGATPFGFEEHPLTIANPPRRTGELEFTIKQAGDFTSTVADLEVGDRVWVDGPHGAFTPTGVPARGLVLIAGGVGITPMMSVLRALASSGDEREHLLVVAAPSPEELLFRDEIAAMTERIPLTVVELVTRPSPHWSGLTGRVDADLLDRVLPQDMDGIDVYVCGPPGMARDVRSIMGDLGVDPDRVHDESFELA